VSCILTTKFQRLSYRKALTFGLTSNINIYPASKPTVIWSQLQTRLVKAEFTNATASRGIGFAKCPPSAAERLRDAHQR